MKKLFFLLIVTIAIITGQVQARLGLPEDLRPEHAPSTPGIIGSNEADYGNFILHLLAGSLLYLTGPIAIFFIAFGGLRYIISHGKQEEMEKAKKTITYAIVGLLVVIFSYVIIQTVISFVTGAKTTTTTTTKSGVEVETKF